MINRDFLVRIKENPVIAAVKTPEGLEKCLKSDCRVVFVLFGSITGIPGMVGTIKDKGKLAIVHMDLIDGLAPKESGVDYIKDFALADGLISTKVNLVRYAGSRGLLTVQRFFILDSIALIGAQKQIPAGTADAIEILPGLMPKILGNLAGLTKKPLIAGGLISDMADVEAALGAGATAISTTCEDVWFMRQQLPFLKM